MWTIQKAMNYHVTHTQRMNHDDTEYLKHSRKAWVTNEKCLFVFRKHDYTNYIQRFRSAFVSFVDWCPWLGVLCQCLKYLQYFIEDQVVCSDVFYLLSSEIPNWFPYRDDVKQWLSDLVLTNLLMLKKYSRTKGNIICFLGSWKSTRLDNSTTKCIM